MTLVNVVQGGTIAVLRPLLITINWKWYAVTLK